MRFLLILPIPETKCSCDINVMLISLKSQTVFEFPDFTTLTHAKNLSSTSFPKHFMTFENLQKYANFTNMDKFATCYE
jgi:hypothetical protein